MQRGIDKLPYDMMISDRVTTEVGSKVNTKYINSNVLIRFEVLNIKKNTDTAQRSSPGIVL